MRKIIFFSMLVTFLSCKNVEKEINMDENNFSQLKNREDSTKWDQEMLKLDIENNIELNLPFTSGIFPTPKYDLLGENSFNGVGNFGFTGGDGYELKIDNKTILFNSFFVGNNDLNKSKLGSLKDAVFFHIVVLTDFVDTVNYSHVMSQIVSRNHPDYMGQGFYKTSNNTIDYAAFTSSNGDAYAIVNMRLFDLNKGQTILIAPHKDKTLRSMQIKSLLMESSQIESFTRKLLTNDNIRTFFTQQGTIGK